MVASVVTVLTASGGTVNRGQPRGPGIPLWRAKQVQSFRQRPFDMLWAILRASILLLLMGFFVRP